MHDVYVGESVCRVGAVEHADLAKALATLPRRRLRRPAVRLWLSGALARPFVVEPVQGLRRWSEAQALAEAQADAATGLDGPCRVWLQDWPGERAALAVAVEAATLARIEHAAAAARVRIASIRPWWSRALAADAAAHAMRLVAAIDAESFTVLAGDGDGFALAATYAPVPADESSVLARLALASGVPPERVVRVQWPAAR